MLRKALYPWLLGSCGRNVVFGQNVVLRHPHKIHIGSNVVVDDNCLLDAKGESNRGIRIGDGVFIGRNTILSCKNGDIEHRRWREHRVQLRAVLGQPRHHRAERPAWRRTSTSSAAITIFRIRRRPVLEQTRTSTGVSIGAGAWIGAGAKILDGVVIGDHAVIGAGAVVREDVPGRAVAVGVPARVVTRRTPKAEGKVSRQRQS